jgi:hypothetical protein
MRRKKDAFFVDVIDAPWFGKAGENRERRGFVVVADKNGFCRAITSPEKHLISMDGVLRRY